MHLRPIPNIYHFKQKKFFFFRKHFSMCVILLLSSKLCLANNNGIFVEQFDWMDHTVVGLINKQEYSLILLVRKSLSKNYTIEVLISNYNLQHKLSIFVNN